MILLYKNDRLDMLLIKVVQSDNNQEFLVLYDDVLKYRLFLYLFFVDIVNMDIL